ncbi:MAG TPA: alpha/beta hydrolase [Gemmatimonadales bacterium]|nr:alpha/beta hydrolase [Gemmatimonadales bacterium]
MAIVLGIAGVYVVLSAVLWALQEKITFPAPRAPLPDPAQTLGYGERIELTMHDGTKLVGWYLPPLRRPSPPSPSAALLWFYGNGETIAAIWPIIREFRPPNAALLVLDYPGYGGSSGRATEAGVYEAGDLAYDALLKHPDVDRQRIYVYGRSLGSAVATHVSATHDVAGLILESPFTSARGMAARHYRIFPRFLVRLGLDNLDRIRRIRCPILIFHGTADMLVPITMGRDVAAAAGGPVEFVMIEGSGHNDTYDMGGKAYREKLAAFVR